MSSLYIRNIGLLATPEGETPHSGKRQGELRLTRDAAVYCENGKIVRIWEGAHQAPAADRVIDAGGALVTPGLCDCHTHLVFGGWRQHEVPLKLRGASYLEILQAGGGIIDTVRRTREASEDALSARAAEFLDGMLRLGVTSAEIKSGYGLDLETERKQLRAAHRQKAKGTQEIVLTFLGAHAVPPEYAGNADGYVDALCNEMLPAIADDGCAEYCDVFCETGVFDVPQSRRVLERAKELGFHLKIHADEIDAIGGAKLAGELHAASAEHLIATDEEGMDALAAGGVVAALLPCTSFYLNKTYARARDMIARGIPVAVASDFNPGSCPSYNLQLCMNLAYLKYRMTPEEVLTAVTLNAACAIGRGGVCGTAEPGKRADFVIWDCADIESLCYRFGSNLAKTVICRGEII